MYEKEGGGAISMQWQEIINFIAVPVLAGIIAWIWKLDSRVFDINEKILSREEFTTQMLALRTEVLTAIHNTRMEIVKDRREP